MKKTQGFTLIELILYVGLTSILIAILSQVFLATLGVRLESQNTTSVTVDSRYILTRLTYDIRRAGTIIAPAEGVSAQGLTLMIPEAGGEATYTYALDGNNLMLSTASDVSQLNSDGSQVEAISFTRVGDTVQISLQLIDTSQVSQGGQRFEVQSTVSTRE
jgi:Tfp pilus assembly protein PilW